VAALITVLTILGWLAVLLGAVVLVWDFITNRVVSRPGVAAAVVSVVLLIVAYALPASDAAYEALALL
jgi:hypothetical protein